MKEKIKKIVKLKESSTSGDSIINWYHVYTQEPTFSSEPKGIMIQETITQSNKTYSIRPLGAMISSNIIHANVKLGEQQNEAKDFYDWARTLSQTEIINLIYGRELLRG
jgi:hypothetical protein